MIVEDDPMISFLHREMLRRNNITEESLTFLNGKEALDFMLRDSSEKHYLVLLDLNMPVMNGWEFLDTLEKIREISCRTKVAIVTSSMNPADKSKAREYAMVEYYLSKPLLDFSKIKEAIQDLKKMVREIK